METRNWKAQESTDFAVNDRKLRMTGEVYVNASNVEPKLTPSVPADFNPSILALDLTTVTVGDVGFQAFVWKLVSYEQPVDERQYEKVDIREVTTIEVEFLIS